MRRLIVTIAVLVAAGLAVLLGGAFRDSAGAPGRGIATQAAEGFQSSYAVGNNTPSLVLQLESRVRTDANDAGSRIVLGLAYQQRARETGDPSYYVRSETALRSALALDDDDPVALSGLGSLALARHRFGEALRFGRQAVALAPQAARNYGVVGDALIELGRYGQAFETFDTMARLRPSLASYARISYARELRGDHRGALAAMQLAVDAAIGANEASAWSYTQLGKLHWNEGELGPAAAAYRAALAYFPGYAYALDALAQVEAARGHLARAIALQRRAVDAIPLPQYVAALGELYTVAGRPRLAREQYALIGAIQQLLRGSGVRTDLEVALFNADHGIRPADTLALARAAHAERPSIDGDDVLAWALERNGRCREALSFSKRALRLGTQDALKFFHRGMIERCLGHEAAARTWFHRALALNPHFSLRWAPVARKLS